MQPGARARPLVVQPAHEGSRRLDAHRPRRPVRDRRLDDPGRADPDLRLHAASQNGSTAGAGGRRRRGWRADAAAAGRTHDRHVPARRRLGLAGLRFVRRRLWAGGGVAGAEHSSTPGDGGTPAPAAPAGGTGGSGDGTTTHADDDHAGTACRSDDACDARSRPRRAPTTHDHDDDHSHHHDADDDHDGAVAADGQAVPPDPSIPPDEIEIGGEISGGQGPSTEGLRLL